MDKRRESFESYATHAWLSRSFKKLKPVELQFCREILTKCEAVSKDHFMRIAVRLFIDQPTKPKHWQEIEELLVCANSSLP